MHPNPFVVMPGSDPEVESIAQRMTKIEGLLPASKQADGDSYYACGPGMTTGQTQERLLLDTATVCVKGRFTAFEFPEIEMSADVVLQIHKGIFERSFGSRTLGFRTPPERHEYVLDDGVQFPILVRRGTEPELVTISGARASQVQKRVRAACRSFENSIKLAGNDRQDRARALAHLYVRLIRVHPFTDGNGRTAWAAVQFAAARMGVPMLKSTPNEEARLSLGNAIRNGQRIDELADHMRRAAWDS